jgi:hypothetical protein
MSTIHDYQVDHLLLLVGSNPIPNAVAGKLLVAAGGTITLIHSAGSLPLAERLESWLIDLDKARADRTIVFAGVEESNADSVYDGVMKALDAYEHAHRNAINTSIARVGLNYTGGTKVMAVQAHRAVAAWAENHQLEEPVFSYLDARTLQMCFDSAPGRETVSFDVSLDVEISVDELLALHNWKSVKAPTPHPILPRMASALLAIHTNAAEARKWGDWLHNELFPVARRPVALRPPFWVSQERKQLEGQYDVERPAPYDAWKSNAQLREVAIPWPDLPALSATMRQELGQEDADNLKLSAVKGRGFKEEDDFCNWLSGTWLESALLSALQDCANELHLKQCFMDLWPIEPGKPLAEERVLFQFDVVAMRGYQLFAFSCTTESASQENSEEPRGIFNSRLEKGPGRGLLKSKLFEVYMRARQMGGDEACAALVCCLSRDQAAKLEAEVQRDLIPEGRIRVFGRENLEDLAGSIVDWVRKQSKGV